MEENVSGCFFSEHSVKTSARYRTWTIVNNSTVHTHIFTETSFA